MSDVNYAHRYEPRSKDGKCKVLVGGRRKGYQSCGLMGDAEVHQRYVKQYIEDHPIPKWHMELNVVSLGDMGDHYKLSMHCHECGENFNMKLEKI